jgi:hypothetical protein
MSQDESRSDERLRCSFFVIPQGSAFFVIPVGNLRLPFLRDLRVPVRCLFFWQRTTGISKLIPEKPKPTP